MVLHVAAEYPAGDSRSLVDDQGLPARLAPERRGVNILDRHILREFFVYTSIGFLAFIGIFVIVDLFEKIDVFVDHQTPLPLIVQYYGLGLPLVIVQVIPVAVLLGAILALGQLKKWGELTAMQICGVTPLRIISPLLAAGAVLSVAGLILGEQVTPATTRMQEELYDDRIRERRNPNEASRSDLVFLGRGGRIYLAKSYHAPTRTLRRVSVQHPRRGEQELEWRLDAQTGSWRDGEWVFYEGFVRRFAGQEETGTAFHRYVDTRLLEQPEDFARPQGDPLYMSRETLRRYIRRLREGGGRVLKYEVDYHIRGSFPFSSLVMALLGSVLSLRSRRGSSVALGVGISLFLGFAYFAFIRLGQALGYHGTLPPAMAAWLGNGVFSVIGLILLWRAHR
ncbi:MAG: LPS export ABC transporter permease LptG [Candidatus Eisenbacteria bacterium]|nr:LPS export ABC transporter permease LptG [Candidatus Eisenbacteria bacterium]